MAEIINLKQRRRAVAQAAAAVKAAENRVIHGRTKAERLADEAEAERARRALDGVQRDPA